MVSIGILLILGVMIIGFLRGALGMTRTGTARGKSYEAAQTVLRQLQDDLEQVLGEPAHPRGGTSDLAFSVTTDPWGRQLLMFTRAWGEEQSSLAGYDAGRGSPEQGYGADFHGSNPQQAMRASRGNLEVVWMMEPVGDSLRLYRAERSPPGANGLIDAMAPWLTRFAGGPPTVPDDLVPGSWFKENNLDGRPIADNFELVAENIVCLAIECWDDYRTMSWDAGVAGPVYTWSISERLAAGQYALPRSVRITLIVAADEPIRAASPLVGEVSSGDGLLGVESTANFPDITNPLAYARVDGEMIAYASKSGVILGSLARGALGTRAASHQPGAMVVSGFGFQRVFQFPVSR
jgi:hypothetical protein